MALTLITGPANAAKAGAAFARLRAMRSADPLLVVPTGADVEHYRAELAESGLVLSPRVVTFGGLMSQVARRTGVGGRVLGAVARERVVRAAIDDVELHRLASSARSAGFPRALGAAFSELERALVAPGRLESAVAAWAREEPAGRHAQVRELAALYRAYRRRLAALDAHDADGLAWAALDALRREPAAWQRRPVLFYGFDDLTRAQLDAVETLAGRAEADVVVTLPYEPGRSAFAGRASTVAVLAPLARQHVQLPERSEHYAPPARAGLHHLERRLFEPTGERVDPGPAVRLLEAGGERAEAELAGALVLELLRDGMPAGEIAVLVRGDSAERDLMARVLAGYGVPVARRRRLPLPHTRLGAGVLALARLACGTGDAEDLLRWARTPGCLEDPEPADRLEALLRRGRVEDLPAAQAAWRGPARPLEHVREAVRAAREGPVALLHALLGRAEATWRAAHARQAALLGPEEALDARVAESLRRASEECERLAAADARLLPDVSAVLEVLRSVEVLDPGAGDGVLLADPLEVRARRFRAVLLTGLQDGRLPRRPPPDPFLGDDDRRGLARASGLRLPMREDVMADERHLLYAACSRPQELLALSWCSSTEEGDPLQPSPFLSDLRALYAPAWWENRHRRLLAEVTWAPEAAPTLHERERSLAAARQVPEPGPLAPPRAPAVLDFLAARRRETAGGLEAFALCGTRWLVDALLRPQSFAADPDPLWRGSLAHVVLEGVLRRMRDETGSARLTSQRVPLALRCLRAELADRAGERSAQRRAAVRALEADLERYLRFESEAGAGLEPVALEWAFGDEEAGRPPLELADGTRVGGRVDRIDAGDGVAVVRDYKNSKGMPVAAWEEGRQLQAGLYALAAQRLLGHEVRAAVYQPLRGDMRPRGAVQAGMPGSYVGTDELDPGDFAAALAQVEARAVEAAEGIRRGAVAPCPSRCSSRGCLHPGVCRAAGETTPDASPNREAT